MPRHLRSLAGVLAVTIAGPWCGGTLDAATPQPPQEFAADDPDFYVPPEPIPVGEHGDLVRYQPISFPLPDVTLVRIMYLSETVSGAPTVVTGVVTIGTGDAPADGWDVLLHGHGSTGLADDCAPSASLNGDGMQAIEIGLLAQEAPPRGFALVSTDYEGLGGPGVHPFLLGVSEGRSMLDAGRAARQLPGLRLSDTTGIAGYSQGGHAALWANQLAAEWTPESPVVGSLAGAPATELTQFVRDDWESGAARPLGVLAAIATTSSDAAAAVDELLTPAGHSVIDTLTESCVAAISTEPPFLTADPSTVEPIASLLRENEPGNVAAASPVLVIVSDHDETITVAQTESLLERQCAAGQMVEHRVIIDGSNHVEAAVQIYDEGLDWLVGLADGAEPISTCDG